MHNATVIGSALLEMASKIDYRIYKRSLLAPLYYLKCLFSGAALRSFSPS
jgi:hypothetical protein